jgi:hypothetical protein
MAKASRRWRLPLRSPVPTRNSRRNSHSEREGCNARSTMSNIAVAD